MAFNPSRYIPKTKTKNRKRQINFEDRKSQAQGQKGSTKSWTVGKHWQNLRHLQGGNGGQFYQKVALQPYFSQKLLTKMDT